MLCVEHGTHQRMHCQCSGCVVMYHWTQPIKGSEAHFEETNYHLTD